MTPATLTRIGRALYGDHWQAPLSRDLGVTDRTMRRWVADTSPRPDGIGAELAALLLTRLVEIKAIAKILG